MRHAPHDLAAERALLASVLLDAGVLDELEDLPPGTLYSPQHATMWGAMRRLHARREAIDLVSLRAEIARMGDLERAGGDEALVGLTETVPSGDPGAYAAIVRRHASVRAMLAAAQGILARAGTPVEDPERFLDEAERAVCTAAAAHRTEAEVETLSAVLDGAIEDLSERQRRGGVSGLPTGFATLDRLLGGLEPGQLLLAAGRPGMGKSAFAQSIALEVAKRHRPVAIFSLEMEARPWGRRFLFSVASVDGMNGRRGHLSNADWQRLMAARARLDALPMRIVARAGLTLYQVRSYARRIRAQIGDLGLVVVDYLQLMRWHERLESREAEFSEISRGLKELAKELQVPVLALAQLNREVEKRADKRPILADLRNSGSLEQDADVVLGLFRPYIYHPQKADPRAAEILVLKQREGALGTCKATFRAEFTRFEDYKPEDQDDFAGEEAEPC